MARKSRSSLAELALDHDLFHLQGTRYLEILDVSYRRRLRRANRTTNKPISPVQSDFCLRRSGKKKDEKALLVLAETSHASAEICARYLSILNASPLIDVWGRLSMPKARHGNTKRRLLEGRTVLGEPLDPDEMGRRPCF